MTVAELQERMSYQEFVRWKALRRMSPWGMERLDALFAYQTCSLLAPYRKPGREVKVSDYLPQWDGPQERPVQTAAEIRAVFDAMLPG